MKEKLQKIELFLHNVLIKAVYLQRKKVIVSGFKPVAVSGFRFQACGT